MPEFLPFQPVHHRSLSRSVRGAYVSKTLSVLPRGGWRSRWRVGAQQPDNRRLQPLGAVNGQDAYTPGVLALRFDSPFIRRIVAIGLAQIAQFVNKTGQTRITSAIEIERQQ